MCGHVAGTPRRRLIPVVDGPRVAEGGLVENLVIVKFDTFGSTVVILANESIPILGEYLSFRIGINALTPVENLRTPQAV